MWMLPLSLIIACRFALYTLVTLQSPRWVDLLEFMCDRRLVSERAAVWWLLLQLCNNTEYCSAFGNKQPASATSSQRLAANMKQIAICRSSKFYCSIYTAKFEITRACSNETRGKAVNFDTNRKWAFKFNGHVKANHYGDMKLATTA